MEKVNIQDSPKRQTLSNQGTQSQWVLRQMPGDGQVTEEKEKELNPKVLPLGFFIGERRFKMREPRIYKIEAVYYITVRTSNNELLFRDESDYEYFLDVLKSRKQKYDFKLYAYCLLSHHYHLLLEPFSNTNISKIMQAINTTYTLYFNKKYNRIGHLLSGRFGSKMFGKDKSLLAQSMYVHLNPLRLRIASKLEDYKWSSYPEYIGINNIGLADKEYILSFLPPFSVTYKELIENGVRSQNRSQNRSDPIFRFRFAMAMIALLILFQFFIPKKAQHNLYLNNKAVVKDKEPAVNFPGGLPIYSGSVKPQERLVWELWKLGPQQ